MNFWETTVSGAALLLWALSLAALVGLLAFLWGRWYDWREDNRARLEHHHRYMDKIRQENR